MTVAIVATFIQIELALLSMESQSDSYRVLKKDAQGAYQRSRSTDSNITAGPKNN